MNNLLENKVQENDYSVYLFGTGLLSQGVAKIMQYTAQHNWTNYNWFQGHLDDFGLALGITAIINLQDIANKYFKTILAFSPAVIGTGMEFIEKMADIGRYDSQDIIVEWCGCTIAYFGPKIFASQKIRANVKYLWERTQNDDLKFKR